jgi:Skp family chaperone for outer membrane proteins
MRVGLVDGSRVVRISQRGQKIRKQIEEEGERLTSKLEAMQKRLAEAEAEHKAAQAKLPAADPQVRAKAETFQKLDKELRETHLRYRKELNAFGERLLAEFKEVVRKAAMAIRSDKGLDLILMTSRGEEQGLWVWPVSDITDEVVKRMDIEQ